MLRARGVRVAFPDRTFATTDHIIPTLNQARPFQDQLAEAMLATRDPAAVTPARAIFDTLRADPRNMPVDRRFRRDLPAGLRLRLALLGGFKRWM